LKYQSGWLADDRHHVGLILPRSPTEPLVTRHRDAPQWIHATESTRRLYNQVRDRKVRFQMVTILFTGGHWQAAFMLGYLAVPTSMPVKRVGAIVGVDLGVAHLVTLSVAGFIVDYGHVANPRHLDEIAPK
jgi:hypothetical protein